MPIGAIGWHLIKAPGNSPTHEVRLVAIGKVPESDFRLTLAAHTGKWLAPEKFLWAVRTVSTASPLVGNNF